MTSHSILWDVITYPCLYNCSWHTSPHMSWDVQWIHVYNLVRVQRSWVDPWLQHGRGLYTCDVYGCNTLSSHMVTHMPYYGGQEPLTHWPQVLWNWPSQQNNFFAWWWRYQSVLPFPSLFWEPRALFNHTWYKTNRKPSNSFHQGDDQIWL